MKFVFSRGSAPDPTSGAYSAPLDPLADVRGPTSKGEERERGNKERKGMGGTAPIRKFLDLHLKNISLSVLHDV